MLTSGSGTERGGTANWMRLGEGVARNGKGACCALAPAMAANFVRSIVSATSKRKYAEKMPEAMVGRSAAMVPPLHDLEERSCQSGGGDGGKIEASNVKHATPAG